MEYAETLKQVQDEVNRRVKEDGRPRVIYQKEGARELGACFLIEWQMSPARANDVGLSLVTLTDTGVESLDIPWLR